MYLKHMFCALVPSPKIGFETNRFQFNHETLNELKTLLAFQLNTIDYILFFYFSTTKQILITYFINFFSIKMVYVEKN